MQPMTPDLARLNDISHLTGGGMTGAMITYVYDNSPAAAQGLEMGDILLRLHVEGHPKPLDVNVSDQFMGMFGDEFWQYIDEMPLEYFDQMPSPWGSVENPLTKALTELGFGTPFTAEVYREGDTMQLDFVVEQGPAYYKSAPRFKSEALGITVRELTYEVRRYYQLAADEPGVIISKIEPGEKAAIAGLRPYELIINVDEQPISSPDEFEAAMQAAGDRKLLVKRMTEGRIVKITVEEKEEEADEEAPEEPPADE
jgi:S1-C subfamily serine protease